MFSIFCKKLEGGGTLEFLVSVSGFGSQIGDAKQEPSCPKLVKGHSRKAERRKTPIAESRA